MVFAFFFSLQFTGDGLSGFPLVKEDGTMNYKGLMGTRICLQGKLVRSTLKLAHDTLSDIRLGTWL